MARLDVNDIQKIEKERNMIHEKVFSTYTVFSENGKKYVQLDTYGRVGRAIPGKISQSVQFDENTARFWVNLLIKEFGFTLK